MNFRRVAIPPESRCVKFFLVNFDLQFEISDGKDLVKVGEDFSTCQPSISNIGAKFGASFGEKFGNLV